VPAERARCSPAGKMRAASARRLRLPQLAVALVGDVMKSRLFGLTTACVVAAFCSAAGAQTVTLFGLIDAAVEHVSKVGPSGSGLSRMPGLTGSLPSRWGVRGSEDLGGGLRLVFTIEQGFTPDAGTISQGGRAFGRQAFVGVSAPWGTLTFGRHYTMLYWSILDADVMGPNLYGSGSLDAYIPNARADNSVSYRGSFSGLTLGGTYSLGRDAVNAGSPAGTNCAGEDAAHKQACREWSAMLKFDQAGWGAALAVDEIRGGAGAFAGLTRSALTDRRISANGYLKLGDVKATLGLLRRDNGASALTPKSDLWYAGMVYTLTPAWTLDAEWLDLRFKHSADNARLLVARASYGLSRRTVVYAMAGHIANHGNLALSVSAGAPGSNPVAGGVQTGLAAGLRHAF
jgi:predicted porin